MGFDPRFVQLVDAIATQKLSGEDLMAMTQAQFVTAGVPFGLAREFASARSKWFAPFAPGTHAVAATLAKVTAIAAAVAKFFTERRTTVPPVVGPVAG